MGREGRGVYTKRTETATSDPAIRLKTAGADTFEIPEEALVDEIRVLGGRKPGLARLGDRKGEERRNERRGRFTRYNVRVVILPESRQVRIRH